MTVPTDVFATSFGATVLGLLTTLLAATIIEVCSDGSVPIADDLMHRASAPSDAFTVLMAGVTTDYMEFLVLKEVTGRPRAALLLLLLTVSQVIVIGLSLNRWQNNDQHFHADTEKNFSLDKSFLHFDYRS